MAIRDSSCSRDASENRVAVRRRASSQSLLDRDLRRRTRYTHTMTTATVLDREEYVEQAYLFRAIRERLADNQPAQDILLRVHEELLASTRLPYAVQFLVAE